MANNNDNFIIDIQSILDDTGFREAMKTAKKVADAIDDMDDEQKKYNKSALKGAKNTDKLGDEAKQAKANIKGLGTSIAGVVASLGVVTLAVKGLHAVWDSILIASDASEEFSKVQAIFGDFGDEAEDMINRVSDNLKVGKTKIRNDVASISAILGGLGFDKEKNLEMTEQIAKLGLDLTSFHNLQDEQGRRALSSALLGETEALKGATGIVVNETVMDNYAKSIGKVWKGLTLLQKAELRLQYIQAASDKAGSTGDYERTQDGFANSSRSVLQKIKDIQVAVGQTSLDPLSKATAKLRDFLYENEDEVAQFFTNFNEGFSEVARQIMKVAEVLTPFFKKIVAVSKEVFSVVSDMFKGLFEDKKGKGLEIFEDIKKAVGALLPMFDGLGKWLFQVFENFAPIAKDVYKIFIDLAGILIKIVSYIVQTKRFKFLVGLAKFLFKVLYGISRMLLTVTVKVIKTIVALLSKVVDFFTKNSILSILGSAFGLLKSAFITFWTSVGSVIKKIVDFYVGFYKGLFEKMKTVITNIFEFVKGLSSSIGDSLGSGFTNAIETFKESFLKAINWMVEKWNGVKNIFKVGKGGKDDKPIPPTPKQDKFVWDNILGGGTVKVPTTSSASTKAIPNGNGNNSVGNVTGGNSNLNVNIRTDGSEILNGVGPLVEKNIDKKINDQILVQTGLGGI